MLNLRSTPSDGTLILSAVLFMAGLLLPTFVAGYLYVRYVDGLSPVGVLLMMPQGVADVIEPMAWVNWP